MIPVKHRTLQNKVVCPNERLLAFVSGVYGCGQVSSLVCTAPQMGSHHYLTVTSTMRCQPNHDSDSKDTNIWSHASSCGVRLMNWASRSLKIEFDTGPFNYAQTSVSPKLDTWLRSEQPCPCICCMFAWALYRRSWPIVLRFMFLIHFSLQWGDWGPKTIRLFHVQCVCDTMDTWYHCRVCCRAFNRRIATSIYNQHCEFYTTSP